MPEEVNRIVTDHVSRYLFAPTKSASAILKNEGMEKYTFLTGDIMVDTMKNNSKIAHEKSNIISDLRLQYEKYNILTLHRNYNVDQPKILYHVLDEIGKLDEPTVFPVHPRTKKKITNTYSVPKNIRMIEPLGYLDFITLESSAKRIITDSGGIQKEAYILKKPCITLRTETEWTETVEEKWNLLINPSKQTFFEEIDSFKVPMSQTNIFGENVSNKMVNIINEISN